MKEGYLLEAKLPAQIKEYIDQNKYVNVGDLTDYLMKTHKNYQRKNRKAFLKSVSKVYGELKKEVTTDMKHDLYKIDCNDSAFTSDEDVEVLPSEFQKRNSYKSIERMKNSNLHEKSSDFKSKKRKRENADIEINQIIKKKKKFESIIPTTSLNDLIGFESLNEIAWQISWDLHEDIDALCDLKVDVADAPKCVLISGPEGSGKSAFIMGLCGDLNFLRRIPLLCVPASELTQSSNPNSNTVKELFKELLSLEPCVLLLENPETLSARESGYSKGPDKTVNHIIAAINELQQKNANAKILILAETRSPHNVDLNLRSKFKKEICMPVLNKNDRIKFLESFQPSCEWNANELDEIALRTSSFVAGDLKNLVYMAREVAKKRTIKENFGEICFKNFKKLYINNASLSQQKKKIVLKQTDFFTAISMVTPVLKREGFLSKPETTWDDVGGLEDTIKQLKDKILDPITSPELCEQYFNVKRPTGIMLYGPPGCGKTLLAKAIANHVGVSLYVVKGPELLSMYQGESERAIREVFYRANSAAPVVIFFDEFDSICLDRGNVGTESGSKSTIVTTLLSEMGGYEHRKDVYIIAATNRLEMVERAALRPGRFDTILYVDLPNDKGRQSIFKACTKNGTQPKLAKDVEFEKISSWCDGFSGADCEHLVKVAGEKAYAEDKTNNSKGDNDEIASNSKSVGVLHMRHFEAAKKSRFPSIRTEELRNYRRVYEEHRQYVESST